MSEKRGLDKVKDGGASGSLPCRKASEVCKDSFLTASGVHSKQCNDLLIPASSCFFGALKPQGSPYDW